MDSLAIINFSFSEIFSRHSLETFKIWDNRSTLWLWAGSRAACFWATELFMKCTKLTRNKLWWSHLLAHFSILKARTTPLLFSVYSKVSRKPQTCYWSLVLFFQIEALRTLNRKRFIGMRKLMNRFPIIWFLFASKSIAWNYVKEATSGTSHGRLANFELAFKSVFHPNL